MSACFYELLAQQGVELWNEESLYLASLPTHSSKAFARPCIVLKRQADNHDYVCFIYQLRGRTLGPIARFFGVPVTGNQDPGPNGGDPTISFQPLRFSTVPEFTRLGRFHLFAVPVVREQLYAPPGPPIYLHNDDLQKTIELAREKAISWAQIRPDLRKEHLTWVETRM
ncbi:hypothetical protein R3P38DRAFT_3194438 [Favolaschia claudopus]|uniref:Uncharacterized protein n=1 Tax=Favolaschia claudopus TaxID=2862362 RepID=A0AAW0BE46_9AGAR